MTPPGFSDPHEFGEPRDPHEPESSHPARDPAEGHHGGGLGPFEDPLEALFAAASAPERHTDRGDSSTSDGSTGDGSPGQPDSPGSLRRWVRLTPVPAPEPLRVAQQAAATPLVMQLDRVRAHLGPSGVALTATGNPRLVDAQVLRDIFATTDPWERLDGDRVVTTRSAAQLPQMMYLLEVAIIAGALVHDGRRLAAAPGWDELDPVQRCRVLLDTVMTIGPAPRRGNRHGALSGAGHDVAELLHVGIVHLSVPAFITGEVPYAEIADLALDTIGDELAEVWPEFTRDGALERLIDEQLSEHLDTFERCGVIERRNVEYITDPDTGVSHASGGTVVMRDLGRHLLAPLLPAMGYRVHMSDDLAVGSALDAAYALSSAPESEPGTVWAEWLPDADPADKVDQLIDALGSADVAPLRLAVASLMSEAPEDARRRIEAIVDGPLGAYALMAIDPALSGMPAIDLDDPAHDDPAHDDPAHDDPAHEGHGEITPVGPHMSTTMLTDGRTVGDALGDLGTQRSLLPLVDLLWMEMDLDPDELIESVSAMDAVGEGGLFVETLQELWRVELPETSELLTFLVHNHPDDTIASASLAALERHRAAYGRDRRTR